MEPIYGLCFMFCVPSFFLIFVKVVRLSSLRSKMNGKFVTLVIAMIALIPVMFYLQTSYATKMYFTRHISVRYGIIFDAGSTGSRMHVFRFNESNINPLLELDDSLFVSIKPGLSSYVENPSQASESLKPMLEKAKGYIPKSKWSSTPVALKATAGLRLLPEKSANAILSEVEMLFKQYPFQLVEDGVSILEGDEEGLFSWFTVNYLDGNLKNMTETSGVLDLGGGSTQITFYPRVLPLFIDYLVDVRFLNHSYRMYTHSYLGLGMMSARFQILGGMEKLLGAIEPQRLSSPCLPAGYNGSWSYRGENHEIVYSDSLSDRLQFCMLKSKEILNKYNVKRPSSRNFVAISYFFDVALEEHIILDEEEGTVINVETFRVLAANACKSVNASKPFRCVDLCHISTLLMDGYGFDPKQPLALRKAIKGFEIAWPLGAIFEVYEKFNKIKRRDEHPTVH